MLTKTNLSTTTTLLILILSTSVQPQTCSPSSPLNLDYPLKRSFIAPEFKFFEIKNPQIQKINHDHFRLIDSIGILVKSSKTFHLSQADFFSPSLHKLAGQQMDLELQIKGFNKDKTETVTFVALFEKGSIPFIHLFKLGIGRNMIKKLARKDDDPRNSYLTLHTEFNFSPYVEDVGKFLHYVGDDVTGEMAHGKKGCPKTEYLVMFEKLWVGEEQLAEFGFGGVRKWGFDAGKEERELYANFVSEVVDREKEERWRKRRERKKSDDTVKIML
jgi:carbonic anhydrase